MAPIDHSPEIDPATVTRQEPAGADSEPAPYKGLASYGTDDSEWFFGRQKLTYTVLSRLHQCWAKGTGPVAVIGPPGSGKSSLIAAGVVPEIRKDKFGAQGAREWPVIVITPGGSPISTLAAGLADVTGLETDDIAQDLRADPGMAAYHARQAAEAAQTTGALLVVDQLEEIFTETGDETERWALLAAVQAIATAGPARATNSLNGPSGAVLLALRADFYHRALREPQLLPVLQRNQIVVGPMGEAELREVIVEPAQRAHLELEDRLADVILDDLTPSTQDGSSEAATLPQLSHVLLATWQRGTGGRMTLDDYRAAGRVQGSVARSADAVLHDMTVADRAVARRALVHLVGVAEAGLYTRRRLTWEELYRHAGSEVTADRFRAVLDVLAEHGFVTMDSDTVRITCEPLMDSWPRLRTWVDARNDELQTGRRLEDAARLWNREDRDPSLLYRGPILTAARDWVDGGGRPGPAGQEFLNAANRRERTRTRRLRSVIAALCAVTLIAVAGGTYAYQQRSDAVQQRADAVAQREAADEARATASGERNAAVSRLVALRADRLRETDPALARQLSLVAYQTAPTLEARSSLLNSSSGPAVTRMLGPAVAMNGVVLNRAGLVLAGAAADGSVRLWDVADGTSPVELIRQLSDRSGSANAVAFHPVDDLLAVARNDGGLQLYDVSDPSSPLELSGELAGAEGALFAVAFSPDGTLIAAAGAAGSVWTWDVTDPADPAPGPRPLTAPSDAVTSLAFSPGRAELVAGSRDGSVHRWNLAKPADPGHIGRLTAPGAAVLDVTFNPDGSALAAASADTRVYRWNINGDNANVVSPALSGPSGPVNEVAFGPGGSSVAAAASDGGVWIWDAANGKSTATLPHAGPLTDVLFEADGQSLYTAGEDGVVRRWQLSDPELDQAPQAADDVDQVSDDICATAGDPITESEWEQYVPGLSYAPPC